MSPRPPRGRRPVGADARGDIIVAARAAFAERGYEAASLRGIARAAGVDPALVHHYFTDKSQLFFASVLPSAENGEPVDPAALIRDLILTCPVEVLGERWVEMFVRAWDSPGAPERFRALMRGVTSSDEALAPLRDVMLGGVLGPALTDLGVDRPMLRAQLAGSQLLGVGLLRYVARLAPFAAAPPEVVAGLVGPTVQRYVTGPLPEEPGDAAGGR